MYYLARKMPPIGQAALRSDAKMSHSVHTLTIGPGKQARPSAMVIRALRFGTGDRFRRRLPQMDETSPSPHHPGPSNRLK
jgi:hypothetical protein